MANTSSVSIQMEAVLEEYNHQVKEATDKAIEQVSKEAVQKLKNTSPKLTGDYAKGWRVKKQKGKKGIAESIVHNKTDYQLTHLLENGHVVKNAKGTYGRTRGVKHIAPVADWANDELPREIERELKT